MIYCWKKQIMVAATLGSAAFASLIMIAPSADGLSVTNKIMAPAPAPPQPPQPIKTIKQKPLHGGLPPWSKAVVESRGDDREDAFLEEVVGGPLYAKQGELPKLPVPSLSETIERFLPTALPLAKSEEEIQTLLEACEKFPSEAQEIQSRLQQRQEDMKDSSWLQQWWNTACYLQPRDPIAVFVSYFLYVPDDRTLPKASEDNTWPGIQRAAAIMTAVAESRKQICSGEEPPDAIQNHNSAQLETLCSVGFKYLFHACRIPQLKQDTYRLYDPSRHRHCIVACRGYFFAVDFIDTEGNPLPLDALEDRLKRVVAMAEHQDLMGLPKLGWLTSSNRDFWAKSRKELLRMGGRPMKKAFATLESGAFVLNLDHEEPESLKDAANLFWHGGESCGANRWFDKTMQIICTKNGRVAYMGEHSMVDAMPPMAVCRNIARRTYKKIKKKQDSSSDQQQRPSFSVQGTGVKSIFEDCWNNFPLRGVASHLANEAKDHHHKMINDFELKVELFEGYGKNFLKRAGLAQDAYVQMAMQLASYRLFGEQVATYEATQVRKFLHGRTETTRPVSPESEAFIKRMGLVPEGDKNDGTSREEKLSLLRQAIDTHIKFNDQATEGRGVDRHFFGLQSSIAEGEEAPSLFSHPAFLRSKRWRVSSSTVTFSPGFGPVVDDGVGIGYGINTDSCIFTCTARREKNYVTRLCELLEEALKEMGELVVETEDKSLQ